MGTLTQQPISQDQIKKLVELHFGKNVTIKSCEKFNEGYFSTTMKLTIQTPTELKEIVLKVSPGQDAPLFYFEKGAGKTELIAIKQVIQKSQVSVPKIHSSRDDFPESDKIISREYFFMEFIRGVSWNRLKPNLPLRINEDLEKKVAEFQFQINSIIGEKFGTIFNDPVNEIHENSWFMAFQKMFHLILRDFHYFKAPMPIPESELLDLIKKHEKDLDEVREPHLVHWDIWPPNILISEKEGNYYVAAIIDFERSFWGDPLAEWCFMNYEKPSQFLKYYGENIFSQKSARIRRNFYTIYFALTEVLVSYTRIKGFFKPLGIRRYNINWINKSLKAIREDEK